ncbi:hypothetical protein V2A60_006467 [Cordyceps javanica]|uniref:FAD-dependent oxidoreductase-like enzyme n=1 Tax=Cordyceps javanica TaxID=43265 RepID=A0A545V7W5_9HYPO|nr:FAD-dependent oxidoreductase-like enzyme [Cordyceps javanica]TQW09014.1 FAD-dependent oxidoreductase-like enzyme [Cordyceps javanica]
MASRLATDRHQSRRTSLSAPTTPMDHVQEPLSQVTLPSTEGPASPIEPSASFKTEVNDDRSSAMVIPSSLTPPPSSQLGPAANRRATAFSQSQQTAPVSPPATILNTLPNRHDPLSAYVPPSEDRIRHASPDQLRDMLETCIAQNHKFKMDRAHHKLQLNLATMQADEESKRAAVEHDMVRRQVDVLCHAEHSRHAKHEFGSPSDAMTAKYLDLKVSHDAVVDENHTLKKRLRAAKKVIQQKEDETVSLIEERDMLLNRIRENREHLQILCSPGGLFHEALTPRQSSHLPPSDHAARVHGTDNQHGLSMILQAMDHENHNNSAPSTPAPQPRSAPVQNRRHSRNAQSMSSLPTTPVNHPRGAHSTLLPSVKLVPQTEPRTMYTQKYFEPITPDRRHGRKSRESTISADEAEDAVATRRAPGPRTNLSIPSERSHMANESDVFGSQASQAAADLLRRHPGQSFDAASSGDSRDGSPIQLPVKAVAPKARSRLPDSVRPDKRRHSGTDTETAAAAAKSRREQGSPAKKVRTGADTDRRRVGLGIQYQ